MNRLSKIGIGTANFGMNYGSDIELSEQGIKEILDMAAQSSINFLDTAADYGTSEVKIGSYLKDSQNSLLISTKIAKIHENESIYDKIITSTMKSLKNLNVNSIDILYLHQTDEFILNSNQTLKALNYLKNRNLIQRFGISVYDLDDVTINLKNNLKNIDVIQLPFSIVNREFESLFTFIKGYNIKIVARSLFLRGELTEFDSPKINEAIEKSLKIFREKNGHLSDSKLKEIAFNYVVNNKDIDHVIIGLKSTNELQEIINYSKAPPLKIDLSPFNALTSRDYDPRRW